MRTLRPSVEKAADNVAGRNADSCALPQTKNVTYSNTTTTQAAIVNGKWRCKKLAIEK
jgi:hypothetical protein